MDAAWQLLVLFLICNAISAKASENEASLLININPDRQQFVDSLWRERFFHGTNVVFKHFPFHPTLEGYTNDSFSEVDMKILQDLGLNVIRLGKFKCFHTLVCPLRISHFLF